MTPPIDPRFLLSAYADGELDAADRALVEAWLAERPDLRDDIDDHRDLTEMCGDTTAPEPADAAWAGVLARIEGAVPTGPRRGRSRGLFPWLTGVAAAGLLIAVLPVAERPARRPASVVPFSLPDADGVEVESLRDADRDLLIVGHPPRPRLRLATADDIVIDALLPHNGAEPMVPMADADAPMVLAVAIRKR